MRAKSPIVRTAPPSRGVFEEFSQTFFFLLQGMPGFGKSCMQCAAAAAAAGQLPDWAKTGMHRADCMCLIYKVGAQFLHRDPSSASLRFLAEAVRI